MDPTPSMPLFGPEEQNGEAMEPLKKPAVHFFQASRSYNGCIQRDKIEYHSDEGVYSVSPLSGAQPANREERESPDSDRPEPPLVLEAGTPHVMVDPDRDLICCSSFGDDWYPNDTFSGGNASRQGPLADLARRLGLGLPPLTRAGYVFDCEDCKDPVNETHDDLEWRAHPPHYCSVCVGDWVTYFPNLEQVFLIVPGLDKAEPGDEVLVYRFGDKEIVEDILKATKYTSRDDCFPTDKEDKADTNLRGVETTEDIGSDGPSRCFEGNGITLYEACASDFGESLSPLSHHSFLKTLFKGFCASRRCVSEQGEGIFDYEWGLEGFPACPPRGTTKIAGGVIEFRVLSCQLQGRQE
ncbi:hypothetical protein INS49_010634 [Diaporthe citri]|uniref:uncharacterized protein n=1 Tax=Diaporthe citri TaxID=83186 RepID=UPI001C7F8A46|nr:uncharacterized protein INS49_010634 [Diaporthe citri]KAG6362404.1 hypothetical protein INS49_010634 [Diaporthe citri]